MRLVASRPLRRPKARRRLIVVKWRRQLFARDCGCCRHFYRTDKAYDEMSLQPLTSEQEEAVLRGVGYSRAQLASDVTQLKLWLHQQIHLPPCRLQESDTFLSNFLVGCKGSFDLAQKKLNLYYSLRGKYEVFTSRHDPEYLDACRKFASVVQLPQNCGDGGRVYLARLSDPNVDVFEPTAYFKTGLLVFEHRLRSDGILNRETYVIDCSNLTLSHFLKVSPSALKAFLTFFLHAYPLRVKKVVIVNAPSVLATAINAVFLPFLSKKLRERYTITKDPLEKVFDEVSLLPVDYEGGQGKDLATLADEWNVTLKGTLSQIGSQFQERIDESRRSSSAGTDDGIGGSFKTLVFD